MTKWMYWLKTNIGKIEITELSAAAKLETLRKEQEGYLWQSFEPICVPLSMLRSFTMNRLRRQMFL